MTPAELLALADAATPGPWKLVDDYDVEAQGVSLFIGANDYTASVTKPQDARLIALAPDLARLVAEMGAWIEHTKPLTLDGSIFLRRISELEIRA